MRHELPLIALFAALTACSGGTPDGARIERARAEAQEQAGYAAELDVLLSEGARAHRWREEHARWASMKAARIEEISAEREKEIIEVLAEHPALLEQLLELRRSGALAPPDRLPPALELIEEKNRLGLRNASGSQMRVEASQLIANASGYPLGHCGFEFFVSRGQRNFGPDIAPGATVYLRVSPAWYCRHGDKKMPLEVVIWRGDTLVWITETRVPDLLHLPPESVEEALRRAEQDRRR